MTNDLQIDAAALSREALGRLLRNRSSTFEDFAPFLSAPAGLADEDTRLLVLEVVQTMFPRRLNHVAPDRDLRARRVLEHLVSRIGTRVPLQENRAPRKILRGVQMDAEVNRFFVEVFYVYRNADGYSIHVAIAQETPRAPYNFMIMTRRPNAAHPNMRLVEPIRNPEDLLAGLDGGRVGQLEHLLSSLVSGDHGSYF